MAGEHTRKGIQMHPRDYINLTPAARFELLDQMGREYYGATWKAKFAADVGTTGKTVTDWRNKGAPVWPCLVLDGFLYRKASQDAYNALKRLHEG